ncbi:MAG: BBP7 family outer membrane beta-barrel protein [Planctomycetota bacterium]
MHAPYGWLKLAAVAVLAGLAARAAEAQGQASQAFYQTQQASHAGADSRGDVTWVRPPDLVDAHGNQAVVPAQYGEACPPGYGGYGGYADMQGAYGGVAFNTDQVGPHYFDVLLEYVSLRRDGGLGGSSVLIADNFATGSNPAVPVLSADAVSADFEPGFRILGRYDLGPLSVLEFGYSAFNDMGGSTSVTDENAGSSGLGNFFSLFTNFGTTPPGGFDINDLEDFEETDRATAASVSFNSDLQTAEMSVRRYWVGYSPRVSGTLLAGFRYTKLKEGFRFGTVGANFLPSDADPNDPSGGISTAAFNIDADNNLAGCQIGGDVWLGVVQGLRLGAEGRVGIYNNSYEITSTFTTSDGDPSFSESAKDNQVAFISDARIQVVADILPSLSIRGGYELLFMNSLALAGDNFNGGSPYDNPAVDARVPFVADQGDALFHGWNLGIEYIW